MAERAGDPEAMARALGGLGDAEYLVAACSPPGTIFAAAWTPASGRGSAASTPNRPMAAIAPFVELRLAEALQEALVAVERARLMTQPRAELVGRHICVMVLAELGIDPEALGTWTRLGASHASWKPGGSNRRT